MAIVRSKSALEFRGVQDRVYDDAGHQNPNLIYNDKGFILAQEKDDNGNYKLIDQNGYLLDENLIWHDSQGRRVEPFYLDDNNVYQWIPLADRVDENGLIKSTADMAGGAELFRVVVDYNGDEAYDETDFAEPAYNNPNTVFTKDDIMLDQKGRMVRGTPVIGTKQTTVKIKSITIEIDALGTQMYNDLSADPQQKNTISITIGNSKSYIDAAAAYYADKENAENFGKVLGVVKGQTTKTSMVWDKDPRASVVSIDLGLSAEDIAALPDSAIVYLEFDIETKQEAAAYDTSYHSKDSITTETRTEWVDPTPEPTAEPKGGNNCQNFIFANAAFVSVALAGVCIVLKKKRR